jgi:hypothetical protein
VWRATPDVEVEQAFMRDGDDRAAGPRHGARPAA